jgi:PASTA domain
LAGRGHSPTADLVDSDAVSHRGQQSGRRPGDGNGSGTIDSQPPGISCDGGVSCAAQFADNSSVTLTARPASGAAVSWSGACSGSGLVCKLTVSQATHVGVTFSMCKTPRLHGKRLGRAEAALRDAQCAVGRVTRERFRTVSRGSVISQYPGAGRNMPAGTRVNLVVSKGKRPR